ncbi:NVEALA domain-containing protein [Bacteroides ihuae]|uniref:NVEALA domain-containing protein n=1 Tax=Bacteroides ihuae TaxID=1852362 RepID=UPI0008D95A71|nr:NVEALA domain-containing protein [Bacteroides ihuae]
MKKLIKIAFFAVVVTISGYGVYSSQKSEVLPDLALANIEALGNGESEGGGHQHEGWCTNSFWPRWRDYCNSDPAAKACTKDDC